jgi:hypothetical protein
MNPLAELREEAHKAVGLRSAEVLAQAAHALRKDRFRLLRQRKTAPVNPREEAYVKALSDYVLFKLGMRREQKRLGYLVNREYKKSQLKELRMQMDRIEFDLRCRSLAGYPPVLFKNQGGSSVFNSLGLGQITNNY